MLEDVHATHKNEFWFKELDMCFINVGKLPQKSVFYFFICEILIQSHIWMLHLLLNDVLLFQVFDHWFIYGFDLTG